MRWIEYQIKVSSWVKPGRKMQYNGGQGDKIFVGEGIQKGHAHFMLVISGSFADECLDEVKIISGDDCKCTRLDLQLTIDLPENYTARKEVDLIREGARWRNIRSVTLIEGSNGYDTIYIGRRKSPKYLRVYIKGDVVDGMFLRYEVEFKQEASKEIWYDLRMGDEDAKRVIMATFLHGSVSTLPECLIANWFTPRFIDWSKGKSKRVSKTVRFGLPAVNWLENSVTPALYRLVNDHDVGIAVQNIISKWYEDLVEQ